MKKLEDSTRQIDQSLALDTIIYKLNKTGLISKDVVQYEIETKFPKLITDTIPLYKFSTNLSTVNVKEVIAILKDCKLGLKKVTLDKYQRVTKFINWIKQSEDFGLMHSALTNITRLGKNTNKEFILNLFEKFPKTIYTEQKELLNVREMKFFDFLQELHKLMLNYQLSDTEVNKFKSYFDPILQELTHPAMVKFLQMRPEESKKVDELKLLLLNLIKYYIDFYGYKYLSSDTQHYLKTLNKGDLDTKISKVLTQSGFTIEFLEIIFLYSDILESIFNDLILYEENLVANNQEFFELVNNTLLDYRGLEFESEEGYDTRFCQTVDMYHKLLLCLENSTCTCEDENQDVDLEQ